MIQHIVLLKWKAGTTDQQVDAVFAQAEKLVNGIDGVERITLGRNVGDADHGFTHAFIVNLADADALSNYLQHPLRKTYLSDALNPIEEERIEIDVPQDAVHQHVRGTGLNWEWGAMRPSASAAAAALRLEEQEDDL